MVSKTFLVWLLAGFLLYASPTAAFGAGNIGNWIEN